MDVKQLNKWAAIQLDHAHKQLTFWKDSLEKETHPNYQYWCGYHRAIVEVVSLIEDVRKD
jgi:hypothetical protein